VRNEFVPRPFESLDVCRKFRFAKAEPAIEGGGKPGFINDRFAPIVLALWIGEQLAPFENGGINESPVRSNPELPSYADIDFIWPPAGAIEGNIPQTVTA
jgi:hypothetical protein